MPEITYFMPSRTMDCASTVAVVVPSPALSAVLEATSFTICAPMFMSLSFSSISLATDTPSLVTVGAPKLRSSTTLRPLGPKVVLTALARMFTPSTMRVRASEPNTTSLAAISNFSKYLIRIQYKTTMHAVADKSAASHMQTRSSVCALARLPKKEKRRYALHPNFRSSAFIAQR